LDRLCLLGAAASRMENGEGVIESGGLGAGRRREKGRVVFSDEGLAVKSATPSRS
jgi:hypothetical protein